MEECPNGLAFLKRYAEGSTEKKVRVLTSMSILVSPEPLPCHAHTGPFGPAMGIEFDLHSKETNGRTAQSYQTRYEIVYK
jgi:hypothetical protein